MHSLTRLLLLGFYTCIFPLGCVDRLDLNLSQRTNIIVVEGILTDLPEPQRIRLNRSQADPLTGRFGTLPITKASVEVVVDSSQRIDCHETADGTYQLPSDFRGQVGHAYQLRFTLSDGIYYESTQQVMPAVPPLGKLVANFNRTSLPAGLLEGNFRSGYDLLVDTQDPASQPNYYRWEWTLWEKQAWCKSCTQGYYMPNKLNLVSSYPNILIYQTQPDLLEDCLAAPAAELFGGVHTTTANFTNDYPCRTQCWEVIHGTAISVFSDSYSNGGLLTSRKVGQVPYYTQNPALVDVRQSSLTADAYRYFSQLEQQTQNTGGLADTPPTALIGNVRNSANSQEKVVGYFTAGSVSSIRHWLPKNDASGIAYGSVDTTGTKPVFTDNQLLMALARRLPNPEPRLNFTILCGGSRPPTALCVPSDSRTPFKPTGWRE